MLVLGSALAAQPCHAQYGGVGFRPPAFASYFNLTAPATPYHATCATPPISCDVDYVLPIRPGTVCWCRSGLLEFSSGTILRRLPAR